MDLGRPAAAIGTTSATVPGSGGSGSVVRGKFVIRASTGLRGGRFWPSERLCSRLASQFAEAADATIRGTVAPVTCRADRTPRPRAFPPARRA